MQKCSICLQEKELTEFNFRNKHKGIQYKHCRLCQKTYRRECYTKNREYYLQKDKDSIKKRREERKEFINDFKKNKPCKDCGIAYPPYVMDFDHLPEFIKKIKIGSTGHKFSKLALHKEFEKCEIVCSNCHRIRTYNRRNGG